MANTYPPPPREPGPMLSEGKKNGKYERKKGENVPEKGKIRTAKEKCRL
jgi:hypothetical protein